MKNFKRTIFTIIIVFVLGINFTYAATSSQLNATKNDLNQKKTDAQNTLNDIKNEKATTTNDISKINDNISELSDKIDDLQNEIDDLNDKISENEKEIEEKEKEVEKKQELLKKRLVSMYKTGGTSYINVLLGSSSTLDMIVTYDAVDDIAKADTNLIDSIKSEKTNLEGKKQELENNKTEVNSKKKILDTEQSSLSAKKVEKQEKVAQLSESEQKTQKEIDTYNEQIREVNNQLAAIAKAATKKSSSKSKSSSAKIYTGGKFTWPCPSYTRISNYFGYRSAAETNGIGSTNHKGIDMAAPYGSSIIAAGSGEVILASYKGGYGNCVMIDHGGGIVTLYGHASSICCSVGQSVKTGDVIAKVGSTGNSTGNHLHFSVLVNGSYVNPASYLGM